MIVNTRFDTPCTDCGAATDEASHETCRSQLATTPAVVPRPRVALQERHRVRGVDGDVPPAPTPVCSLPATSARWLGEREGLNAREGAIVALIVLGLSNQEIAAALHISMDSTKSRIRSAYRKMGVASRTHAISWGVHHGLQLTTAAAGRNDGGQW